MANLEFTMPTKKPILIGYTSRGTPVYDHAPDEPIFAPLLAHLAQPDEPNETATDPPDLETSEDEDGDDAEGTNHGR